MTKDLERGQVLLVVLLVMVIVLTVGLSVASRNITNLRTSREEATSQKALAAAEAGIEQVLKTNTPIPIGTFFTGEPNTTYGTTVNAVLGTALLVTGGNVVPKDEGADIWLVAHNADNTPNLSSPWSGDLTIYWGSSSDVCNSNPAINTMAALEVAVVSGPVASPVLKRYTYDPCSSGINRRSNNNFKAALGGGTVSGKTFSFSTPPLGDPQVISVVNGFVVRVVPLYSNTPIGVIASIALPSQGSVIDSTGESQGTTRKINVFKGYPQLPIQFFVYGLFSP